tara:strand:+ start:3546 stop:4292 length:747 start_codon:yes stop_codon:yes gene_type:complete
MKKLLIDKSILITGSNRGIGKSLVERAAANGANIWANARKRTDEFESFCENIAKENNTKVMPIYFDLKNKNEILDAIKSIKKSELDINGLINNAGITYNSLFQMSTEDNIRENLDINFIGPFLLTQYVVKLMTRVGGGSIVSISSSAAMDANSGRAAYGASKAALQCSTKSLSREVGEINIRANTVAPGITKTDMISSMTDEVIELTAQSTSLKRCGNPDEIANVCIFLMSDLSSYITGQTIRVDGGM